MKKIITIVILITAIIAFGFFWLLSKDKKDTQPNITSILTQSIATSLLESIDGYGLPEAGVNEGGQDYWVYSQIAIADINKDGIRDFIITYSAGNCWTCWSISIFNMDSVEGNLRLISPLFDNGDFSVTDLKDYDSDGIFELEVTDARFEFGFGLCHGCSPGSFRIFKWNGKKYVDKSSDFKDVYLNMADDTEKQFEPILNFCRTKNINYLNEGILYDYSDVVGPAISIFMHYENAGLKKDGWRKFEEIMQCAVEYNLELSKTSEKYGEEAWYNLKGFHDRIKKIYETLGTIEDI